jgi:hypothetical protein
MGAIELVASVAMASSSSKKSDPEFKVRYSEKFLRERSKENRKWHFIGATLLLALSVAITVQSIQAFRTHSWMDLGSHVNQPIFFPPIVGALVALLLLLWSIYLFWSHFRRNRR